MHSPYKLYGFYVGGRKLVNVDVDNDLYEEIKKKILLRVKENFYSDKK